MDQPVEQEPTGSEVIRKEPVSTLRRLMTQRRPPSRFRDFTMDLKKKKKKEKKELTRTVLSK